MDKQLIKSFLNRTFFKSYIDHKNLNYKTLELIINPICNLNCDYCYFIKNKDNYFKNVSIHNNIILQNTEILFNYLFENNFTPDLELFGGDPLMQKIGFDILNKILEFVKKGWKIKNITIPTNGSFILIKEKQFLELKEEFNKFNVNINLSLSIDGKCLDDYNRKQTNKKPRPLDFYKKIFSFAKKIGTGFHPMIYSKGIEFWPANWLWFQEMFEKYNIPFDNIYLLEVRNKEWNKKQILKFSDFLEFLIDWTYKKLGNKGFIDFVTKGRGYNILGNIFSTIGRGIGCSIQSTLGVRLSDLMVYPCHRLMYTGMEAFQFEVVNNKIIDIIPKNISLYLTINSVDRKNFPICENCKFKNLCSSGCLGSQYETTGEPFTPIPSVCLLEQIKILTIIYKFEKLGVLDNIKKLISKEKIIDINNIQEEYYELFRNIKKTKKLY